MSGVSMLMREVLKAVGIGPDQIAQLHQFIAEAQIRIPQFVNGMSVAARRVDERMERIERNQHKIMAALAKLADDSGLRVDLEPEREPEQKQIAAA